MVMELIKGRTLRDIIKSEGALLPRRAAEITAEAAAALTVAHAAGVFHRDVKPGNIMITPEGGVKVTDFGIARALDDSEELTRTGRRHRNRHLLQPRTGPGVPRGCQVRRLLPRGGPLRDAHRDAAVHR